MTKIKPGKISFLVVSRRTRQPGKKPSESGSYLCLLSAANSSHLVRKIAPQYGRLTSKCHLDCNLIFSAQSNDSPEYSAQFTSILYLTVKSPCQRHSTVLFTSSFKGMRCMATVTVIARFFSTAIMLIVMTGFTNICIHLITG